ncbi:MAG: NRDE family protein [Verrucomicrobiota bacterium]
MCTVSFIARKKGYALAMNRDEKLARVEGLPPSTKIIGGRIVLAPSEPGGGTWIALNDGGATLALINWYSITARVSEEIVSRGMVVNATSAAATPKVAEVTLNQLPLKQINPFRLIGVFPATNEIVQWSWDLKKLARRNHPWQAQQWISSGFDEPTAQRIRSQAFRSALQQRSAGSLPWLRRLHRSHSPETGPFSTCMHRADAATVSYTEAVISPGKAFMRYHAGPPCNGGSYPRCPLGSCRINLPTQPTG